MSRERPAAIVTGGLRGIGRACAEALAKTGFDIVVGDLADRPSAELEEAIAAHGARLAYCVCDISDLGHHAGIVARAQDTFGRVDCLVNNAGIASPVRGDLLDLDPANFDQVIDVNLRGTVFLSQRVVKAMLSRKAGGARTIINITSLSAESASPERADYCISKAGLSMWTKLLTLRLAAEGIAVFEVRPGIIRTQMTAAVAARYDALIGKGLVPMRRWGEPSDVGEAVAALASGKLNFATGSVLKLDGALSVPRL